MRAKEFTLNEFAPGSAGGESGRWYTDDQITDLVGDGWWNDLDVSGDIPKQQMIQQAQAWLDDQGYSVQVLNCRLNDDDMDWFIEGSFHNPGFAKEGVAEGSLIEFQDVTGKNGHGDEESKDNYDTFISHLYDILVKNGFMKERLADVFHNTDKQVQVSVEEQSGNSNIADITIQRLVWARAARGQQGQMRNGVVSVLVPGKSRSFTVDLSSDWEMSRAIKQVISTVKEAMTQGVAEGSLNEFAITPDDRSDGKQAGRWLITYMTKDGTTKEKIMVGKNANDVSKYFEFKYRRKPLSVVPYIDDMDLRGELDNLGLDEQGMAEATGDERFDSMMGRLASGAAARQGVDRLSTSLAARTGSNPEAALANWGQEFIKWLEKICRNIARQGVDKFSKFEKLGNSNDGGETMAHWLIEVAKQSNTSGITLADIQEFSSEFNSHGMWAWQQFPIAWSQSEWQDYKDQWTGPDGYIANLGQGVEEGLNEFAMSDGDDGEDPTDNYPCYDCGSTIFLHHTKLCDLAEPNAKHDLPARPGSQHWTGEIPKGLHPIPGLQEGVAENFADGKHPEDKGDSKRYGVPTKASISTLRKVAKQGGRKGQLAHWMANMKSGHKK